MGINRDLVRNMEARLIASELLEKCGVLLSRLATEIEVFQLHLITTTYGDGAVAAGKTGCWTVVLTMVRAIWGGLRKVRVEVDTAYGSYEPSEMVGKHLWGTLLSHRVMEDFLRMKLCQHSEVDPQITLHIF